MKMIRAGRVAPVLVAALSVAACNDNLTDINKNPNQPTTAPAPYVLTNAQTSAIGRALGDNFNMTLTGLWAQHYAKVQYIDEDKYELRPATVDAHFAGFYTGPLRDFAEVMRQGQEQNKKQWVDIGNIMSVWTWHLVTDIWGDVPYSEALKGSIEDGNNVTPVYDTQASIYADLIARLNTAQASLAAPGDGNFGDADVVYNGSPSNWRRFANSMILRLAMRESGVASATAAARAAFEAAATRPLIATTAQTADLDYGEDTESSNPIYQNRYIDARVDHAISKTMVDLLAANNDPRLEIYAAPTEAHGTYVGQPNGSDDEVQLDEVSMLGDYWLAPTAPAPLFTAAETFFLLAEAKQMGWNVPTTIEGGTYATALDLYTRGVVLALMEVGVSQADAQAYAAAEPTTAFAANALTAIRTQKWIALMGNGPEAYAEFRRTNQPLLYPAVAGSNGGRIPVRVPYPTIEQSLNNTNLQVAVGRQGGLTLNDRVWWDVSAVVYPSN